MLTADGAPNDDRNGCARMSATSKPNRIATVRPTPPATAAPSVDSPAGADASLRIQLRSIAAAVAPTTITKTAAHTANITHHSHVMDAACGPAGSRTE